ncbi:MAG: pyridoxal phosphate-dependent aminotransferase [Bryobacteraceae bacterium]
MKFSKRLHWDLTPNRFTELLKAKRAAGETILDLTQSNPTSAGLDYPAAEILSAFADPRNLLYEPSAKGLLSAREAISADPERLLLTASTSEAYAYLFKLLTDPGDEILVPRPSYPLFEFLATLESVRVVRYPLFYHEGWSIDMQALASSVTDRTRAVVVVNPNNPTGSYLKRGELEQLLAICGRHELAILSDEVFADYAFAPDPDRVAALSSVEDVLTFSMSGLSKVCGLPQLKLGWIQATGPGADEAIERLEFIADTFLSVGTPVQHALPQLLAAGQGIQNQIRSRTKANLAFLLDHLVVEGGWSATIRVPRTRTEEEWVVQLLNEHNVLVQPGYFYDFDSEAFLVLSLLTPPDVFQQAIQYLPGQTGYCSFGM